MTGAEAPPGSRRSVCAGLLVPDARCSRYRFRRRPPAARSSCSAFAACDGSTRVPTAATVARCYAQARGYHAHVGRRSPLKQDVGSGRGGAVERTVATWEPAVVFHLAALHFIPHCESDPARTIEIKVLGTQRVIDAVAGRPGCRLILVSTGDVYASAAEPHCETSPPAPGSLYGITKLTGEFLIGHAAARGAACRIARLFNVFGPGDRTPHVHGDSGGLPPATSLISRTAAL